MEQAPGDVQAMNQKSLRYTAPSRLDRVFGEKILAHGDAKPGALRDLDQTGADLKRLLDQVVQ
jgi:hypothetical protein